MVIDAPSNQIEIEAIERELLHYPQGQCPTDHHFAPGVYVRSITMRKGQAIIGHEHLTEHVNIVSCGRALVSQNGGPIQEIVGPCIFVSKPGVRKMLVILEDMLFTTVHPTNETDLEQIEMETIRKSEAYLEHESEMMALTAAAKERGL